MRIIIIIIILIIIIIIIIMPLFYEDNIFSTSTNIYGDTFYTFVLTQIHLTSCS